MKNEKCSKVYTTLIHEVFQRYWKFNFLIAFFYFSGAHSYNILIFHEILSINHLILWLKIKICKFWRVKISWKNMSRVFLSIWSHKFHQALIAQLDERWSQVRGVPGSNPARNIKIFFYDFCHFWFTLGSYIPSFLNIKDPS